MYDKDKNVAVAEMLGAVQEEWYPPNKDTNSSGVYLSFPSTLYEYLDADGKKQQYKWYPDNVRYHNDSALKFGSDANWQREVVGFLLNKNCSYMEVAYRKQVTVTIRPVDGSDNMVYVKRDDGDVNQARLDAFFKMSEYYKQT